MHLNPTSLFLPTKAPWCLAAEQPHVQRGSLKTQLPIQGVQAAQLPSHSIPWHIFLPHFPSALHKAWHVFSKHKAEASSPCAWLPDWLKQKWKVKQLLFSSSCLCFPICWVCFSCSYPHPIKGELKNHNNNDNVHYDKGDAGRKWDA